MNIRTSGIANSHLYLARAGTTIDSVLVSETAKPDYSPESNWTKLSEAITTLQITPVTGTVIPVMRTVGGHQVLRRNIRPGPASVEITFTQQDTDLIVQELEMMTGPISAGAVAAVGDFVESVPFAGTLDGVKGWFQLQQYNQDDELVRTYVLWGELVLDGGVTSGNEVTAPKLKLTVFKNALNRVLNVLPTDHAV
ncbi:MAG: hypothetical protein V4726_07345 [Verrucomicrobiota bacterium]